MVFPSSNTVDRFFAWIKEELPFWVLFILLIIIVRVLTIYAGFGQHIPVLDYFVNIIVDVFKDLAEFLRTNLGIDIPGTE